MRQILVFFLFVCILQNLTWQTTDAVAITKRSSSRALFDDELREFIEFLRLQMRCGYADAGIPPLAPYQAEFKEFAINQGDWNVRGNLTDLTVTGLDEFDVVVLSWNNVFQKLTFDFNFGSILMKSAYKMNALTSMFGPPLNFYGDGNMQLEFQNLRAYGSFKLRPSLNGGLHAWAFKFNLELGGAKSKSTGFMNSAFYSKIFDSWIEEFLKVMFEEDNAEAMSAALENLIQPPLNSLLKNISMPELIAIILGLAGDILPKEPIC
ncbi:uncharacterized protein LOC119689536 [Teleopsis dalmanni]|uniref:uncharacterized protein LOC119689536 n=1 Tax=Teleopsis dalmanni TaxID=139649 RepID=UPI0018CF8A8B|nr:uncharacterized protein LOC119689536 [Teleopsis dalmanni]